ncbi:MAG: 3-deoxy-7-phosphoheptulonate synthase [Bdellovibrionales bacterium]|nr:3-deoxy-7-phosphoheptulonate synthase [Bdellovibrionales bacterium]
MKTKTVKIGSHLEIGKDFVVMAGPCSIESLEQFENTAKCVSSLGVHMLRGGMFKLRTNPESFQGLGKDAYNIAKQVKNSIGLPFISEVTDPRQIADMYEVVDMFQVGSRNMHNYVLLKELGSIDKPVLLKRGFSGLIKEWLLSADYIANGGNENVVLCERGIRTFETATRNTFDINAIAYIKENSSFPIIADPSHGVGKTSLVAPIALAAAVAGADGLIVEIHPEPEKALSDGYQALDFAQFEELMMKLPQALAVNDRTLAKL